MPQPRPSGKEALLLVRSHLGDKLKLSLSPEKTQLSKFSEGFSFLGFDLCSRSVTMRAKSVDKFKTKIREMTERSHNLDDVLIGRLNRVIRGTANYFAPSFSHNRRLFTELDKWVRVRLRSMKFKRKWKTDNRRLRLKHFRRRGLLSLRDFYALPA